MMRKGTWLAVSTFVVQLLSHVWLFATPWTAAHQASLFFIISPRVCSNSCPLSWWCHPTVSSSVVLFSSCLQSFPASGPFPTSQLFTSGGRSIGASALASVLPMNIQGWFPLGLTGLISLQSKGLSRVSFSNTVWKHQFFGTQPSLMVQLSHPYMTTGETIALTFHVLKWNAPSYEHMWWLTYFLWGFVCMCLVTQSCLTLCYPSHCGQPGSSVHEFSRQEYWNGLPFSSSRGPSRPGDQAPISCVCCMAGGFSNHWTIEDLKAWWFAKHLFTILFLYHTNYPCWCLNGWFWGNAVALMELINWIILPDKWLCKPKRDWDLITDVIYLSICTPTISDSFLIKLGSSSKRKKRGQNIRKGKKNTDVFVPHLIILINHNRLC